MAGDSVDAGTPKATPAAGEASRGAAAEALGRRADLNIANYGHRIEERLTGLHETARYDEYFFGVSDRGASVRSPWQVEKDGKGYIEDRRPNANCDPYIVTKLIIETIHEA